MSRYQERLQALAVEEDAERRLELAGELDADAAELDENWGNRDAYDASQAEVESLRGELAAASADRDQWKQRYADRFFDSPAPPVPPEPRQPRIGYDNLWE